MGHWLDQLDDRQLHADAYPGQKLIELEPAFYGGHLILGTGNWTLKKYDDAVIELNEALKQNHGAFTLSWLGCLMGAMGEPEKARQVLRELQDMSGRTPVGNFDMGIVYAGLAEKELTLKYFENGFEQHEGMMVFIKHWAKLVPWFQTDPGITALVKRIGVG